MKRKTFLFFLDIHRNLLHKMSTNKTTTENVTLDKNNEVTSNSDQLSEEAQALLASMMPKMDDKNLAAAQIMATKGLSAALQYMLTDQETGQPLSYSEMRSRYG
jgi:peptide deformylase